MIEMSPCEATTLSVSTCCKVGFYAQLSKNVNGCVKFRQNVEET